MSNIFEKIKIGQAAVEHNKFNLSHDHLTTTDFGQLNPINCIDCLIGDKFKVGFSQLTRVAPMVFPSFVDAGMRVVSAFVPYYLLADDAEAYFAGLKQYAGSPASGRYITRANLDLLLYGDAYKAEAKSNGGLYMKLDETYKIPSNVSVNSDIPPYIFIVIRPNSNTQAYRLTYKGKYFFKILRSLGYDISRILDFTKESNSPDYGTTSRTLKLNALPLLGYMRAYADLMLPTALYSSSPLLRYLYNVKSKSSMAVNNGTNMVVGSDGVLNVTELNKVIPLIFNVYYDSDYFTSAWQDSNSPITDVVFSRDELDTKYGNANLDYASMDAQSGSSNTWLPSADNMGGIPLSAQQLKFLTSFDKFVRRNNLVGYREFNAIYSRFGIKPSQMRSNYTQLIDVRNMPLTVGDVTATAQSEGTFLGSYAGKGFIKGDNVIEFECNDFGIFIQFAHLYAKPIYFQGFRKHCLKNNCFDHYQPEFDGVGAAPISSLELVNNSLNNVFGWTERYNEYRFGLDQVTGDFANDEQMYAWHSGRVFTSNPKAQTDNMLRYVPDEHGNYEYDRIFSTQNVDNPFDHFYQAWHFDISALRKIKQMSTTHDLGLGNIVLDRNGSI